MPTLPAHPNLDQLRHQAKDLLQAAKAGDTRAIDRIHRVSDRLTLAAAQLAVAREYGFSSWPALKAEVDARSADLDEKATAFIVASVGDHRERAARMLADTPELSGYSAVTALLLGDAARVRAELERDPELAKRTDPRWGWTALQAVCGSRWHRLDPARTDGLVAAARLLLDAGSEVNGASTASVRGWGGRSPLSCAVATASSGVANEPLIRLLLERGAIPVDADLYLVAFADADRRCLRLLLDHTPDVAEIAATALGGPIGTGDAEGVRLMLDAGVDPRRFVTDEGEPGSAVYEAISSGRGVELVELLLAHRADPNAPGPDGRSPYRVAVAAGRRDLAELLRRYGADDDATDVDRFLMACQRADREGAQRELADDPGLLDRMTETERGAIVRAAQTGDTAAVGLMLDLGFPLDARGDDGATPLHAAAYAGSADTVRLLLERGADIEAVDTRWHAPALDWAAVGSGERPRQSANPDWVATVRTLIEAGASTEQVTLSPDDPKPPSPEVAEVLRGYGVGGAGGPGGASVGSP
jgi:hypothetical protein